MGEGTQKQMPQPQRQVQTVPAEAQTLLAGVGFAAVSYAAYLLFVQTAQSKKMTLGQFAHSHVFKAKKVYYAQRVAPSTLARVTTATLYDDAQQISTTATIVDNTASGDMNDISIHIEPAGEWLSGSRLMYVDRVEISGDKSWEDFFKGWVIYDQRLSTETAYLWWLRDVLQWCRDTNQAESFDEFCETHSRRV